MMQFGLVIVGLALAVLVLTDGQSRIGGVVEPDQFAALASGGAVLALVLAGFWQQFRDGMGANLRALGIWALLGLACMLGYAYRDEAQVVAARVMGELRPGTAEVGPGGSVTIRRSLGGAFTIRAAVNGKTQSFAFDTGASTVVLTAESAAALGIRPVAGDFQVRVATANGVTTAAPIFLESIAVGPITERRVSALVARPGALSENLLGQTFLERLPSYSVRGNRLVLEGR